MTTSDVRHDWTEAQVQALYTLPFLELVYQAQQVHRQHFQPNTVQLCTLHNIKAGACPEDCAYCSQSIHHNTDLRKAPLDSLQTVLESAKQAKARGATRFCMAAAWRQPTNRQLDQLIEMVKAVNALGLETCLSAGMLSEEKALRLKEEASLDYYNHNLDTSREHYPNITKTRTYDERLETLEHLREAGIKVCCGGIMGLGEAKTDRVRFLMQLANLPEHPQSVPINQLFPIKGTPLEQMPAVDRLEFVRIIALARVLMPKAYIRLACGRQDFSEEVQAFCFMAGANSIFYGERLLTQDNVATDDDKRLLERLGIHLEEASKVPEKRVEVSTHTA